MAWPGGGPRLARLTLPSRESQRVGVTKPRSARYRDGQQIIASAPERSHYGWLSAGLHL